MLTIITCPKQFKGLANIQQRNAIISWTKLSPKPEIILLGNDPGVREFSEELKIKHVPDIEYSEFKTPMLNSLLYAGQKNATGDDVLYVNADIILLQGFIEMYQNNISKNKLEKYLFVGERWTIELNEMVNFNNPEWKDKLIEIINKNAWLPKPRARAMDYFLFPNNIWKDIPPFILGRARWDNWFIYKAKKEHIPIYDCTKAVTKTVIHQDHGYMHIPGGMAGPEYLRNKDLLPSLWMIWDAEYMVLPNKIIRMPIRHRMYSVGLKIISNKNISFIYYFIIGLKKVLISVFALMKKIVKFMGVNIKEYGINIISFLKDITIYIKDYLRYFHNNNNRNFKSSFKNLYPMISDKKRVQEVEPVYFYQSVWFAKIINKTKPKIIYDIGSSIFTLGIISQFVPVKTIDIRKIDVNIKELEYEYGNIIKLPFENNSIEFISSLCVIEHIGLGRYGDPIDPFGSEKAINEIARILKKDGIFVLTLPVDIDSKIYFNAHRSFSREYIIELLKGFELLEEKYIYGNKMYDYYEKKRGFGTGCYVFRKL